MSLDSIKAAFSNVVNHVSSNISLYVLNPITDFTHNRKIGAANLISFMVSWGASCTKLELLDFVGLLPNAPSASAFSQKRVKLKPDALEAAFHHFNSFCLPEYFVSEGHSAKGFYCMQLNAL